MRIDFRCIAIGVFAWFGIYTLAMGQSSSESDSIASPVASSDYLSNWQFLQEAAIQPGGDNSLSDLVLGPEVFDGSRLDLADLRLYDSNGTEIAYAMRVRHRKDATEDVKTNPFNQTIGADKTSQLSLDLGETRVEHNEVEVELPGNNFRRHVLLEGSDDGDNWSKVAEQDLLQFGVDPKKFEKLTIH